jgi:hypothetical protein
MTTKLGHDHQSGGTVHRGPGEPLLTHPSSGASSTTPLTRTCGRPRRKAGWNGTPECQSCRAACSGGCHDMNRCRLRANSSSSTQILAAGRRRSLCDAARKALRRLTHVSIPTRQLCSPRQSRSLGGRVSQRPRRSVARTRLGPGRRGGTSVDIGPRVSSTASRAEEMARTRVSSRSTLLSQLCGSL